MPASLTSAQSAKTVFGQSIKLVFKNWKTILKAMAVVLVLVLLFQSISNSVLERMSDSLTLGQFAAIRNTFYGFILICQFSLSIILIRLIDNPDLLFFKTIRSAYFWKSTLLGLLLTLLIVIAIGLASFLLIIPGMYLSVIFSFAIYIYILEKENLFDSLKKSYLLSKGYGWMIFGRILFMLFLSVVVALVSIVPVTGVFVASLLSFFFSLVFIFFMGLTYKEIIRLKSSGITNASTSLAKKVSYCLVSIILFSGLALFSSLSAFVSEISNNTIEIEQITS